MKVNQSPDPVNVRQESTTVALSGDVPQVDNTPDPPIECVPMFTNQVYQYANPADDSDNDLIQGGLFDLDDRFEWEIQEFRASVGAGNVTMVVEERTGIDKHPSTVHSGSGVRQYFSVPIPVLPSQVLKVTTTNPGWVDIYVVKATPL